MFTRSNKTTSDKQSAEEQTEKPNGAELSAFPSVRALVSLYISGAVISLLFAYDPQLGSPQKAGCLALAMLFALGAVVVGILSETADLQNEDRFPDL